MQMRKLTNTQGIAEEIKFHKMNLKILTSLNQLISPRIKVKSHENTNKLSFSIPLCYYRFLQHLLQEIFKLFGLFMFCNSNLLATEQKLRGLINCVKGITLPYLPHFHRLQTHRKNTVHIVVTQSCTHFGCLVLPGKFKIIVGKFHISCICHF